MDIAFLLYSRILSYGYCFLAALSYFELRMVLIVLFCRILSYV